MLADPDKAKCLPRTFIVVDCANAVPVADIKNALCRSQVRRKLAEAGRDLEASAKGGRGD
jgi:hypothetical protein